RPYLVSRPCRSEGQRASGRTRDSPSLRARMPEFPGFGVQEATASSIDSNSSYEPSLSRRSAELASQLSLLAPTGGAAPSSPAMKKRDRRPSCLADSAPYGLTPE